MLQAISSAQSSQLIYSFRNDFTGFADDAFIVLYAMAHAATINDVKIDIMKIFIPIFI